MSRTVVILAYPDCQLLDVSGPWQVFASANDLSGSCLYRLHLAADAPGSVATNSGLPLLADTAWRDISALGPVDTLLVAGGRGVTLQRQRAELLTALHDQAGQVRRLGSICTGAFLLAAAGLLDERQATTHWRHCAQLASDYPRVRVVPDALYVESGGHFTSAGVTAGIDLALSLLEADHGSALAGQVARELVLFLRRPGGNPSSVKCCAARTAPRVRCENCSTGSTPTLPRRTGWKRWPIRSASRRATFRGCFASSLRRHQAPI
ncbi:AraC family transcriptional regulator [Billgrantia tianxiuensis]|uniref:AraC family transcriptional regulator n=1 Tax=Billgrantia tianxiuensis TaxID=2497861 RepID=UPI0030ED0FD8